MTLVELVTPDGVDTPGIDGAPGGAGGNVDKSICKPFKTTVNTQTFVGG